MVPEFLGELTYDRTRAVLLSDVGGACLAVAGGALLEAAELRRLLYQALAATAQYGVIQGNFKLDNFHLVGDRIMVVDLEKVSEVPAGESIDTAIEWTLNRLVELYQNHQYCMWEDGYIAVVGKQPSQRCWLIQGIK